MVRSRRNLDRAANVELVIAVPVAQMRLRTSLTSVHCEKDGCVQITFHSQSSDVPCPHLGVQGAQLGTAWCRGRGAVGLPFRSAGPATPNIALPQ